MNKNEERCSLCGRKFESSKVKMTHNCPEKPEDVCETDRCCREPKEGSDYCPAHTNQVWIEDSAEPETTSREIPVFEVEIYYSYELRGKVKAPNKKEAKLKAEEEYEKRYDHQVHKNIKQVGTEKEVETNGYKNDKNYLRLNTMEPAKQSDFLEEDNQ